MDAIDRQILAELQVDGRLTVTELAERVRLSAAPCHRRLREMERTGVLRGYRAVVDPAAVGLNFEVIVSVTMSREDAATIAEFEAALAAVPEVRHAERLFGDPDHLLRIAAMSLPEYAALRDEALATLPGVQRLTSTIVMKRVVEDRPLPLEPAAGHDEQRARRAGIAESRAARAPAPRLSTGASWRGYGARVAGADPLHGAVPVRCGVLLCVIDDGIGDA